MLGRCLRGAAREPATARAWRNRGRVPVLAPSYLQFANSESQSHKLGDAKQAKVVESLRRGLKGFQAGGHDFMLDAAVANNPGTTEKQLRSRLINMMQVLLKNATDRKSVV